MPHLSSSRLRAALLIALVAAACSGDSGPAAVARVAVTGVASATDSLTVGDRRTLVAVTADRNGAPLTGRAVAWSSADNAVATVDAAGLVSAVAPGQTTITAESEGVRGQVTVSVRRRPVAAVALDRAVDTLWLGRARTLQAQPRAADGSALVDRPVTWSSADPAIASVTTAADGSVVARGAAVGATLLVARSEGASATVSVVVIPVPVASLTLQAPDSVSVGGTATVRATATAPDGTPVSAAELAGRSVTWSSDRTGVLTVAGLPDPTGGSPSGLSATVRAVSRGSATVTAALESGVARRPIVTVGTAVATVIFSSTRPLALRVGDSTSVVALALDALGQPLPATPMSYAITSGANVVTLTQRVSAEGTVVAELDAVAPGTATLVATAGGRSATLVVRVKAAVPELLAYPTSITAAPGAAGKLAVTLLDAAGNAVSGAAVTYASSNQAVATVDASGRVAMVSAGTASLSVKAGGLTATVAVTVSPAPASTFRIDVRPVGDVPAAVLTAARQAAQRWERVITTALPAERVDFYAGACEAGTPALHEQVPGVIVFLKAEAIDGAKQVLAYAGPCAVRDPAFGGLPIVGTMTMDVADVAMLTGSSGALALDVLTHELGHVLGIGTLWDGGLPAGNLTLGAGTPTWRFTGAAASAAAAQLGLAADAADGVPIEDDGGLGTAGGHWRETVFRGELMTGWINPAPNPLTAVTVQALRDLGYAVTEAGADVVSPATIEGGPSYSASMSKSRIPGATSAPIPLGERLRRPTIVVKRR